MIDFTSKTTINDLWDYQCSVRPHAEFLVFEDPDTGLISRYTYAQSNAASDQVANMLLARGIGRGDVIAVHLYNSVEFIECFFAAAKIGAAIVPLSPAYTATECAHLIHRCDVKLLVTEMKLLDIVNLCVGSFERLVVGSTGPDGYESARDAMSSRLNVPDRPLDLDLVEIMFTSGTTAAPKGVMFTHANLIFSGHYVNWELSMTPGDRFLTSMAVTHVNFQLSALLPVLTAGSTLVLVRRYSATRIWEQVQRHNATLMQSMAMMVRTMLKQPVNPTERDHKIREIHYFLNITTKEKDEFEDRFGVTLLNNYGSTESLVGVITDMPNMPRRWPSIGKPGLGYQVKVLTEAGQPAEVLEAGEFYIKGIPGRSLMAGYFKDPEETNAVLDSEGWFRTGDFGCQDSHGYLYFLDRACDLIKRAGENVSAAEVEQVLMGHPSIREVAVIGVPDPIHDESVKAIVVPYLGQEVTATQIRDFAAEQLAYFKVPGIVEIRKSLPRGEYGKVLKNFLRESHHQLERT